jgi:hypothetical protein
VILLDLRALADAPQLDQRISRVGLALGAGDRLLIRGRDDAELGELGVADEVEADQVGARFLQRRELFLQRRLGRAP